MFGGTCIVIFSSLIVSTIETNNFGPYNLKWKQFKTCAGPKKDECGIFSIENAQNMSDVVFKVDIAKDCYVTKAKIASGIKEDERSSTRKTWNYSINKPCAHFVFGTVLIEAFNVTSNCKIKKGKYEVHMNVKEKSKTFFGASFFYGTYEFKIMAHNTFCNLMCVHSLVKVEKFDQIN